ncbi:hypothetical protein JF780_05805 [Mycobacterium intracellulare]|uniref:hypothetical protein n=1 Tax=Mycobacterium intracellulare TaxID=1767 RepID=UPI001927F116|nr:hypothetical protein [Mycobacterium intracellulare]MCA2275506.1 hypothetical protein [Mycobacterium intracellulare]MCA2324466.1 hypothetical protein [Mycobacterium intracellulare]BCP29609.1 hypothetical protein MINTM026_05790 [Mycobacterium intracellulare]
MSEFDSFEAAREQAADCLGYVASERIRTPRGEVFEIPNPSLLDDEQQTRYDALQLDVESWDRHDDVLNDDGSVKTRGGLKDPARKGGELVENYSIQLAKAIFGERYEAFKAAGGRANDVSFIWAKMNKMIADRRKADSKSAGSDQAVAPVPEPDSI